MEILLREVSTGQKNPVQETKLTIVNPDENAPYRQIKISVIPEWLSSICNECGNDAYPSEYYKGGRPTLVQVDSKNPEVLCDACREKLIKTKDARILAKVDVPPNADKIILHGYIEWSVTGDRWYSVSQRRIEIYSNLQKSKRELYIATNLIFNALHSGRTLRGKAQYNKDAKILRLNVDSFTLQ